MTHPQDPHRRLPAATPALIEALTVLQGYTELALARLARELPPDHPVFTDLRHVLTACARLTALVRPLLPPS